MGEACFAMIPQMVGSTPGIPSVASAASAASVVNYFDRRSASVLGTNVAELVVGVFAAPSLVGWYSSYHHHYSPQLAGSGMEHISRGACFVRNFGPYSTVFAGNSCLTDILRDNNSSLAECSLMVNIPPSDILYSITISFNSLLIPKLIIRDIKKYICQNLNIDVSNYHSHCCIHKLYNRKTHCPDNNIMNHSYTMRSNASQCIPKMTCVPSYNPAFHPRFVWITSCYNSLRLVLVNLYRFYYTIMLQYNRHYCLKY